MPDSNRNTEWYVLAVNSLHIGPDVYEVAVVAEHEETRVVSMINTYLLQAGREDGAFERIESAPEYCILHYVGVTGEKLSHLVVWDCKVETITYN